MAIKFNALTFDLKDLILICGAVAWHYNFKSEQKEMYNDLKLEIKQIVSDNKIQEVKVNARFDAMLNKQTSQKETNTNTMFSFVAVCNNNRLEIVKKRLFKYRLV